MLLTGMSAEQLKEVKDYLDPAWKSAHSKANLSLLYDEASYREVMKFGFLETLDFLINQISPDGNLNTDKAKLIRSQDEMFNERLFIGTVDTLAEYWPSHITGLLVSMSD